MTMELERVNAHPRDSRIVFDPVQHKYWIDGVRYPSSVSGLIHDNFPQFDGEATVNSYFDGWARNSNNKYYRLIRYLRDVLELDQEQTKAEIVRLWNASGVTASTLGTDVHLQIELCLNKENHQAHSPEFVQYAAWRATHPTWQPYRTEWSVFSEPELICGQIDSLWIDERGSFHMADWKRVAEMDMTAFKNERGYPPFDGLQNTNYYHYVVQQNVYSWMLERNYGIMVSSMCLVQLHPDLDTFVEHPIARIDSQVDTVMAARRRLVGAGELRTTAAEHVKASATTRVEETESVAAQRFKNHIAVEARELEASLTGDEPTTLSSPVSLVRTFFPAIDEAYPAWCRTKGDPFNPLANYLTMVCGAPDDVAKLQIAHVCRALDEHVGGRIEGEGRARTVLSQLERALKL